MKKLMFILFMVLMGGFTGLCVSLVVWYGLGLLIASQAIRFGLSLTSYGLTFLLTRAEAHYFAESFF